MLLKFVVSLRRYTCYKRTNDTGIWKTISEIFWLGILDKLLENYIELYQYWISFSHNIKIGGGGRGEGSGHADQIQNKLPSKSPALIKTQSLPEEPIIFHNFIIKT